MQVRAGEGPARTCTWADFVRSRADTLPASDFFETVTPSGARVYAFAAVGQASEGMEHAARPGNC
ncbi:hypothetical protein SNOUR_38065 [Streptomyces noursei ATCC 11455]|nr:hypothetical protein SNOUR_38065 [Streptomyces noursei ATCC 11455]